MAKQIVSLTFLINATPAEMENETDLRNICMKRMHEMVGTGLHLPSYATDMFREYVTIEAVDDGDDEDEEGEQINAEIVQDFLITKDMGL